MSTLLPDLCQQAIWLDLMYIHYIAVTMQLIELTGAVPPKIFSMT